MDGIALLDGDRITLVYHVTEDVEDAAQRVWADRYRNRRAGVHDLHATPQPFRRVHRYTTDPVIPEMLLDLKHQVRRLVAGAVRRRLLNLQRVEYRRKLLRRNSQSTTAPMTWTTLPVAPVAAAVITLPLLNSY